MNGMATKNKKKWHTVQKIEVSAHLMSNKYM